MIVSVRARQNINNIVAYLSENGGQKAIKAFLAKIELFYRVVAMNPRIFAYHSKKRNIRNYAITKHYVVYYKNARRQIDILTVFDSRQSQSMLKQSLR